MHLVKPGQHVQLRVWAYNHDRHQVVLDSIELVHATGVTQQDTWTLNTALLVTSSEWDSARRDTWVHDPGARRVAGTVVPPPGSRLGHNYVFLNIDATISGTPATLPRDDTTSPRWVFA